MKVQCYVSDSPPSLVNLQSSFSCKLPAHGHGHTAEGMLYAGSDCWLDMIQILDSIAKRMIA